MKKFSAFCVIALFSLPIGKGWGCASFAQTTLPTSWSFTNTTFPAGWTSSGTGYYSASGNTPPALKFDGTGDWLQIFFADDPGPLTYYLTGNTFSGGTFTVEESVNGTTWTTLHTHTAPPAGTYSLFTDTPNTNSRYIRFFYTTKVTGNIGLDDVNLAISAASPTQEINIKLGNTGIFNGGTAYFDSPVSTTTPISFTIENSGTVNSLSILSATVSGPNAGEFVVSSFPDSVSASGSGTLTIDFTPSQTGTRLATLSISNDDPNENPYIVKLYGVGGSYASEPAAQPASLAFSNVKSYRLTASFTEQVPNPDGYLVLRKTGSAIADSPADGLAYLTGDLIGSSQVVYSGPSTSFSPNNIVAATDYYFAVFAFNGPGQYRNYLQAGPLSGNTTTPANMMGNYYNGISVAADSFVTNLHNKINPHTSVFYGNYQTTMIPLFEARDTSGGQKVVTCVYSGYNYVYTEPFGWSVMSREHTYCHNWMPSNPADNPEKPEYNDQHHLFPTQFSNVNQVRLNYPLGEVVNVTSQYLGSKFGKDASGRNVFEPRDEHKGDAARALMYMAVCYNGVSGLNWKFRNPISTSIQYGQDQDILKIWHYQDPPDNWEIARNDFLDSLQGNRNPFIDSVNFACYIDFLTMTKISSPSLPCNTVGMNETVLTGDDILVFPNPSSGKFTVRISDATIDRMEVANVLGEIVFRSSAIKHPETVIEINLPTGLYTLYLSRKESVAVKKIVIE